MVAWGGAQKHQTVKRGSLGWRLRCWTQPQDKNSSNCVLYYWPVPRIRGLVPVKKVIKTSSHVKNWLEKHRKRPKIRPKTQTGAIRRDGGLFRSLNQTESNHILDIVHDLVTSNRFSTQNLPSLQIFQSNNNTSCYITSYPANACRCLAISVQIQLTN